jgi:hypothetical protein
MRLSLSRIIQFSVVAGPRVPRRSQRRRITAKMQAESTPTKNRRGLGRRPRIVRR